MSYFKLCITFLQYLLDKLSALENTNQRIKPCILARTNEICDGHFLLGEFNDSFTLLSKAVLSAHMNFLITEKGSRSKLSFLLKFQICQVQTIECFYVKL